MPFKAFSLCMYLYNMMYPNQFSIQVSNVIKQIHAHKFLILRVLEKATVHFIRKLLFTAFQVTPWASVVRTELQNSFETQTQKNT